MNDNELIEFTYHPNLYSNDIVKYEEGICQCCGKKVNIFINFMYAEEDVSCICLECVQNGKAAKKFNGTFIQDADPISSKEKEEILFKHTPGYSSWQGEYWLACCDDYCNYLGDVGRKDLDELGITDEVIKEYCDEFCSGEFDLIKNNIEAKGSISGYLFRCRYCDKYKLYVDMD